MKKHRYVLWVRFVVVARILCDLSINSLDSLRTIMDENTCALGIELILRYVLYNVFFLSSPFNFFVVIFSLQSSNRGGGYGGGIPTQNFSQKELINPLPNHISVFY